MDPVFNYVPAGQRVPADHPLRVIRQMTDEALRQLSPQFEAILRDDGSAVGAARAVGIPR